MTDYELFYKYPRYYLAELIEVLDIDKRWEDCIQNLVNTEETLKTFVDRSWYKKSFFGHKETQYSKLINHRARLLKEMIRMRLVYLSRNRKYNPDWNNMFGWHI